MQNITSLPTLYKRDDSKRIREWIVQYGWESDDYAGVRTVTGLENGKQVVSEWNIKEAKNIGKKNATTSLTQAMRDAEANWDQRIERGYFQDVLKVDTYDKFKPMLAASYEDNPTPIGFSQPKLDGIRCIVNKDGMWTRAGKAITSCPHIFESVKSVFTRFPSVVLDGELYNHDLKDNFNKITSLVRKLKSTEDDLAEAAQVVQYHVYDIFDYNDQEAWFDDRLERLQNLDISNDVIKIVETVYGTSQSAIDSLYSKYMEDGYEGQMVRHNTPYQNKRSKGLLKRKEFITEEFKVVEVIEGLGNWAGYIKRFVCELPDGNTFGSGIRGTQSQLKELLESGKTPDWATIRYFNLTPDGVPRFPVVVDYGFGKRED